jgi:hypothetical protein
VASFSSSWRRQSSPASAVSLSAHTVPALEGRGATAGRKEDSLWVGGWVGGWGEEGVVERRKGVGVGEHRCRDGASPGQAKV